MLNLKRTKELYTSYKRILDIISDGDVKDDRKKLLFNSLTLEDVYKMQDFIKECEDIGVHLIKEIN